MTLNSMARMQGTRFWIGNVRDGRAYVTANYRPLDGTGHGYDWGHDGIMARRLARSILHDHIDAECASWLIGCFTAQVIAKLPKDGFYLTADDIDRWLHETWYGHLAKSKPADEIEMELIVEGSGS